MVTKCIVPYIWAQSTQVAPARLPSGPNKGGNQYTMGWRPDGNTHSYQSDAIVQYTILFL